MSEEILNEVAPQEVQPAEAPTPTRASVSLTILEAMIKLIELSTAPHNQVMAVKQALQEDAKLIVGETQKENI